MTRAGRSQLVDELAVQLLRESTPIDRRAVAVALEIRGVRDVDAVSRYGHADVMELADELYRTCRRMLGEQPSLVAATPPPAEARRPLWQLYAQGLLAALPMVVPLVGVVLGIGLAQGFDEAHATALVLGLALSFVVAGGPMQAIGRLGSYYRSQGSTDLATRITCGVLGFGLGLALAAGLSWYAINAAFELFPQQTGLASSVYGATLVVLWLQLAVLHVFERYTLILVCVGSWFATYIVLASLVGLHVLLAQGLGIAAAIVFALTAGVWPLWRRAGALEDGLVRSRLPRRPLILRMTAPYVAFGALYFTFLFADRFVGWSASAPQDYAVFFRRAYETGVSFALFSLVPTLALIHAAMHAFTARCASAQRRFGPDERLAHNRALERFYVGGLTLVAGVATASAGLTYILAHELGSAGLLAVGTTPTGGVLGTTQVVDAGVVAPFVFFWSALAYGLLAWGLFNAGILFSLSRPAFVVAAMGLALIAGSAVGIALSRSLGYWYSAAGLAVGAFLFALCSAAGVIRVLRRLDYHIYAAA